MVCSYYPILALLLAEGTGAADCFRLPKDFKRAFELLQTANGRKELSVAIGKRIKAVDWHRFDRHLSALAKHRVEVVTFLDAHYPAFFRDIAKSPPILFYKGDLRHLARRGVGIVGSRRASVRGRQLASALASDLAALGIMVVSGAARGIDAAAHAGALRSNGSAVAVIGTGIDISYPPENAGLLKSLADQGCVLTEQLMGTPPRSYVFPLRNRLISGLSHIVVVVEAAATSGALLTARWALEQGRDVGAVPGFPGDARSQGVNSLLKMGACPIEDVHDILEAIPLLRSGLGDRDPGVNTPSRPTTGPVATDDPSGDTRAVFEALGTAAIDPDTLAEALDKPVTIIHRMLLDLEMRGLIGRDSMGGYYRL